MLLRNMNWACWCGGLAIATCMGCSEPAAPEPPPAETTTAPPGGGQPKVSRAPSGAALKPADDAGSATAANTTTEPVAETPSATDPTEPALPLEGLAAQPETIEDDAILSGPAPLEEDFEPFEKSGFPKPGGLLGEGEKLEEMPADAPDPNGAAAALEGNLVPAEVGAGAKGQYTEANSITVPIAAGFRAQERIAFSQVVQGLQMFRAAQGRKPKSQEEFMNDVIQANAIRLPELPEGEEYYYNADEGANGELMIRKPKP